jgi:hypothetical protein
MSAQFHAPSLTNTIPLSVTIQICKFTVKKKLPTADLKNGAGYHPQKYKQ